MPRIDGQECDERLAAGAVSLPHDGPADSLLIKLDAGHPRRERLAEVVGRRTGERARIADVTLFGSDRPVSGSDTDAPFATEVQCFLPFDMWRRVEAGSQFESSRAHHAVAIKQRFPGSLRKAPNWRGFVRAFCLCRHRLDFRSRFGAFVSAPQN
jgi:hypothetical protein